MRFRYIGEEPATFMGFQWIKGVEHDVTDEHAIKKLSGSCLFEKVGETPKRPGRKPADKAEADAE